MKKHGLNITWSTCQSLEGIIQTKLKSMQVWSLDNNKDSVNTLSLLIYEDFFNELSATRDGTRGSLENTHTNYGCVNVNNDENALEEGCKNKIKCTKM